MNFTTLTPAQRLALLEPPQGRVRLVLDTDTANEIDDQFALAYALLSPQQLEVEAVYAAPFLDERSGDPAVGMRRSYDEILRVLAKMGRPYEGFVFPGSTGWLEAADRPVNSAAADDLIARARETREGPLYVVAIGAITNVASALLAAPDLLENIVVVWLGGNPHFWPRATEFNVYQDMMAARVIFDSGVALVHVPCMTVTEQLRVSRPEMEQFVRGRGAVGDYLCEIFAEATEDQPMRTRSIWDLGPLAWLAHPEWAPSALIHSPILTTEQTWSHSPDRHFIREVSSLDRDAVFADFFKKLAGP
ncbi:MAG: nucleoside hydrolase [Armatimonadetes bacterium]|nr:nucleoside hydrolase [Armatimonadota bacterium]